MTNTASNSVLRIDPLQAQRAIAILMKSRIVPVLVGAPGCGKTTAVVEFTKKLNAQGVNAQLVTKCLSQMDISNFSLPKEIEARVHDIVAEWIPLAQDETKEDPYTVIFFDEIDRCGQEIQNIILNIILAREVASKKISSKVVFVGAMNGSSDIYTTQLSGAAINRVCMLYIHSSNESYDKWASDNGISPTRRAFQKFKANEIINNEEPFEDVSYASNRSLDAVDSVDGVLARMKASGSTLKTADIYEPIVAGLIGVPAMREWVAFKRLYEVAETPDVILADPMGAKIDYEPSIKYAVLTSVVDYAKNDFDLCEKAFQFASRFEPEYMVAFSNLILEKKGEAAACPTFLKIQKRIG